MLPCTELMTSKILNVIFHESSISFKNDMSAEDERFITNAAF